MKNILKIGLSYIARILMKVCDIIPIKKNCIVFHSYGGEQYSCNPKYISEYLEKHFKGKFEIIWLLKKPEDYKFLHSRGIKVLHYNYFNRLYYETIAKCVINNIECFWPPLRKNQIHINTWHGGGYYKSTGLRDAENDSYQKWRFVMSSRNTSYIISTNQCFTDREIRRDFAYQGDVLNIGFPRNDLFFKKDLSYIRKKVCNYFKINETCKIMMYAPTWRNDGAEISYLPDFNLLKEAARKRFGGEWIVLIRMHFCTNYVVEKCDIYNANYQADAPDMQELLAACDLLISDYSSCIWDFSLLYRPCLLFTPDLDIYSENRGFEIDIHEWGFPICKTEQEMCQVIENFDLEAFQAAMVRHHESLGSFEHGDACEQVSNLIFNFCYHTEENQ